MIEIKDKKDCCGCHACLNACPVNAIKMERDNEGFLYPKVIEDKCINCSKCNSVCPIIKNPLKNGEISAYGIYSKDKEEHMTSSSGGVFAEIAKVVLSKNGIVCGAAFNKEVMVEHIVIDSLEDLYKLKGTKYVQSELGLVFTEIKKNLLLDKTVLFSGTPCQVAGLKKYLGKDYDNLLCVDLICHGVPSPMIWKKNLNEISNQKVVKANFRNKEKSVSEVYLDYFLEDESVIQERYSESSYIKGFIQNMYIRPSCSSCNFKGVERCSDLTIGDFWSINEFHPNFSNGYGTSAVIVHTKKGDSFIKNIEDKVEIVEANANEIACWNECLLKPMTNNKMRSYFFDNYEKTTLKEIVTFIESKQPKKKNSSFNLISKVKEVIKRWLA